MVVLDTDHLSLMQSPESIAKATLSARLKEVDRAEFATTIVTYEEQARGWLAYKSRSKTVAQDIFAYAKLRRLIEDYRTINVLDFEEKAGAELEQLRRAKIRLGTMDLKIAAIVRVHNATLLTRNLVDFRKVPGLKAEDWTT